MALNRRELLKFFGIGTVITPTIGGAPVVEAASRLLAVPEVQPLIIGPFPQGHEPNTPKYYPSRLKWNPYEAIWLRFWQIENNPPSAVNYGIGILEHLLEREPTADEKSLGAAIMQWFGTNCGHGFIVETLNACGYRVVPDENLPNARQIQKLQHYNVWRDGNQLRDVKIDRRGCQIILRQGYEGWVEPGKVSSDE